MTKPNSITLTEYQYLQYKDKNSKQSYIEEKTFIELEKFVLENEATAEYLKITMKKPFGKVLQAQNYVGIIQTRGGITIEILPKIASRKDTVGIKKSKEILINMLKTLKNSPFKNIKTANLKGEKTPLYEIFISMFLEELTNLLKKGIRSDYIKKEENLRFLKGKLKLKEQIKHNFIHRERFYVEYDEFMDNRIENRIIKTTLEFLYKRSKLNGNKKRIREFIFVFDDIHTIYNYKDSFTKIKPSRQMKDYDTILRWCKIFLLKNSFSPYKGREVAFALLFDMNMLFESYVGEYLKKKGSGEVRLQDRRYHLSYSEGRGRFRLKPDIVIEEEGRVVICDTKWKMIDREPSQSDMYQLYAYGTKYDSCESLYLIYPYTEDVEVSSYEFYREEGRKLKLEVIFFDLEKGEFIDEENLDFLKNDN